MKKGLLLFGAILLHGFLLWWSYFNLSEHILSLDDRLRDFLFITRGPIEPTGNVVIVDIDEKSLEQYGQWPWSRNVVAELLYKLEAMGVGIIGLDIVFAESDKSSPAKIASLLNVESETLEDFDQALATAASVDNTLTIGGYFFSFEFNSTAAPSIPAVFIEKGFVSDKIIEATGVRMNIPIIQDAFFSSGFFNNTPDIGGMVRHVPLVIRFDGLLYPSLPMEMIRIFSQTETVRVESTEDGVDQIVLNSFYIPTDKLGRLSVNYRGPARTFEYISASDILHGVVDREKIEGKFVLVGTSARGLFDMRSTPFDAVTPGVEIHATVIDEILNDDIIYQPEHKIIYDLLMILVTVIISFIVFYRIDERLIFPLFVFFLFGMLWGFQFMLFEKKMILNIMFPLASLILTMIIALFFRFIFEQQEKRKMSRAFSKKVSPAVMNDIMTNDSEAMLAPREKEVTIFFSDIRSFTSISEKLGDPRRLIELLNDYMTPMVDIVVQEKGTIDKFIGDAVMAYWNAPLDVEKHADHAVMCALKQLEALEILNKSKINQTFDVDLKIGIGINTGITTIGEMGSTGRSDYTIIGDHVNLASRLEGLCKPYGVKLIISEFTKALLRNRYVIRDLDAVKVKGKEQPVRIFEVMAQGDPDQKLIAELARYDEALAHYRNSAFEAALEMFDALNQEAPHTLYNLYMERCHYLMANRPENFDGVFTFTTK